MYTNIVIFLLAIMIGYDLNDAIREFKETYKQIHEER